MNAKQFTSTKIFIGFPCCHRQPSHPGHCRFVHGYERSFKMWFACDELTQQWFVADFGALKEVRAWLVEMFDHTCLVNEDDPELATFRDLHERSIIDLRIVPNVSMESTSKLVLEQVNRILLKQTGERAWCFRVETRENEKNSAMYEISREIPPPVQA